MRMQAPAKSSSSRWPASRSMPSTPAPPIAAWGSTESAAAHGDVSPTCSRATRRVGARVSPTTPLSTCEGPRPRPSACTASAATTDWLAPVSTTKGSGGAPSRDTGTVMRL